MFHIDLSQERQEALTLRFRQASRSMRRAFTSPPRRGSEGSDSEDSANQTQTFVQVQDHL